MKHKKLLLSSSTTLILILCLTFYFANISKRSNNTVKTLSQMEIIKLQSIGISDDNVSLIEGETKTVSIVFSPENCQNKDIAWSSNNNNIATVNSDGTISAISEGNCIISVNSTDDESIKASVDVFVSKKLISPPLENTDNNSNIQDIPKKDVEKISPEPETSKIPQISPNIVSNQNDFTYIDGILIVNKTYSIPQTYNPGENSEARNAFNKMKSDAKNLGLSLCISSGYRSYKEQQLLYNKYISKNGIKATDISVAKPGHSEHQTGLAFDLHISEETKEYNWLKDNAHLYGFIIRYPEGKQAITGFKFEPWHIRYVGTTLAEKLYHSKLCIEEYFNIDSKYK